MADRLAFRSYVGGLRAAGPLMLAVAAFGVSFGVLARAAGMGVVAPIVMSATTFAGSAQFAAVSILGAGGTLASAAAAAVLLNARYGPIGLSMAPAITGPWWSRLLQSQMIVDETWALAADGRGGFRRGVLLGAGALLYVGWVGGTALGAASGDLLGDPASYGLDAAFPALFLALLVGQLSSKRSKQAAMLGAAIALALTPLSPPGVPIVAAAAACVLGLARDRPDPQDVAPVEGVP
jgi:4-azaleucine resistance transporter AzlC